jgi:O-antigen ligase
MERFSKWALTFGLGIYILGVAVSQSLMSLGATLLCVQAICHLGRLRHLGAGERRLGLVTLCLVLWNLATIAFRMARGEKIQWSAFELLPLMLVPLLAICASRTQLAWLGSKRIFRTLLFVALAGFLVSTLTATYQGFVDARMATGFMRNPIFLAYNLLFPLVFLLSLIPTLPDRRWQRLGFAYVLLILAAIVATNSRMVLGLSLLLTTLLLGRWILRRIPWVVTLLLLGAMAGLLVHEYRSKPYVRARFEAVFDSSHPSTQGRLRVWRHNLDLMYEHPLVGTGYKQNALRTRDLESFWQNLWGDNVSIYAHNIYLQAAAESGLIGLALLLLFMLFWLRCFPSTWPILLALSLGGLTENILTNSKQLHSLICVLLVAGLWNRLITTKSEVHPDPVAT